MQGEVLIVDDDKTICLIHKYLLKTVHNIEPRFYTCAGDALKCIADSPNSSKYIIYLDINMPVLNGWDFLERLYQFKNKDRFSVILVTSSIDAVDNRRSHHRRHPGKPPPPSGQRPNSHAGSHHRHHPGKEDTDIHLVLPT